MTPKVLGLGLGKEIVDQMKEVARDLGHSSIFLSSTKTSKITCNIRILDWVLSQIFILNLDDFSLSPIFKLEKKSALRRMGHEQV